MKELEPEETEYEDKEVDSIIADGEMCDHEEDEEVIPTKITFNDHFINKLCIVEHYDEECNKQPLIYQ